MFRLWHLHVTKSSFYIYSYVCFLFTYVYIRMHLCMHIIGILRGYAIRSGRRPEGSQRPQGGPQVRPGRWLPADFIQYQYIVNETIVKLRKYTSNDLPKNGLPTRAWRRQPSHQLDKVSEGRRPEHLLNNTGTILKLQLRPSVYMGLFLRNA